MFDLSGAVLRPDTVPPTLESMGRIIEQMMRLVDADVTYDEIVKLALADDLSFNEALVATYKERFSNAPASA